VFEVLVGNSGKLIAAGNSINLDDNYFGFPNTDSVFVLWTNNNGQQWDLLKTRFGDKANITSISSPSQNTLFISGFINNNNAKVIKTIDHGQTWTDVTPPVSPNSSFIDLVQFYDNDNGVVIGDPLADEFQVYQTMDGGNSWSVLADFLVPDAQIGEFTTGEGVFENHIWFSTNFGRVYHSNNRGQSWEVFQSVLSYLEDMSFSDTLNGIALYGFTSLDFSTSPIIITADGGHTWKQLDITPLGPKTGIFGACYIPNSSYIMLTTAKNSLLTGVFETWISPDRGETWQQISSGENIYTIHFLDAETGWGGEGQQFDHPTRMFKYTGSPLVGLFNDKKLSVNWSVFPNPSAGHVQVCIQEENPGPFLVLVNDLQGKLLLRKEWDGNGLLDLDLGSAAPGAYVVTLSSANGKATSTVFVE
ncbi:MAG: T9SS type A sorting domain-containing protein, partial [Bacteroidetes bacterium]|nr:T9SS type A sorting domain-containing protein [Bacteroidota bacterium]